MDRTAATRPRVSSMEDPGAVVKFNWNSLASKEGKKAFGRLTKIANPAKKVRVVITITDLR